MEKLSRRSDGLFETQSGHFAVRPVSSTGSDGEHKWFDFHATPFSAKQRLRWPIGEVIAVIPQATAMLLLTKGYAKNIVQADADTWNDRIDNQIAADATDPAPTPQDAPETPVAPEGGASTDGAGERASEPQIAPGTPPLTPPADYKEAAEAGDPDPKPDTVTESLVPDEAQNQEEPETNSEQSSDEPEGDAEESSEESGEDKSSGKKGKTAKRSL